MPLYENGCTNQECAEFGKIEEHFFPRFESPNPICSCGKEKPRYISGFAVIWSRSLGAYGDKTKENFHRDMEGHWMIRKNKEKLGEGQPERVFIDSIQAQRKFCKEEGLVDPSDCGPVHVHSDGKGMTCNGLRGQWV